MIIEIQKNMFHAPRKWSCISSWSCNSSLTVWLQTRCIIITGTWSFCNFHVMLFLMFSDLKSIANVFIALLNWCTIVM